MILVNVDCVGWREPAPERRTMGWTGAASARLQVVRLLSPPGQPGRSPTFECVTLTPTRTRISLRRTILPLVVFGLVLAYYQSRTFYAMTIGWVVGTGAFFIVVLMRRDQIRDVLRCYTYAGMVACLAWGGISPPDI